MAKQLKLRRGTTSQHSSFTGAEGECTVDTTKDTLVVHDGSQAGGRPLLREDLDNIGTGVITAAMLGSNSVDSSELVDGSVDHSHLAADCVDGDNLADNACDSEHYTDGSIDTVHLAADAVTGAKIADDAIGSEHLNGAIVGTANIAGRSVTLAKMDNLARGKIIYGDTSGDPAALAIGSSGQVLTTDGTDISWGTAAAGATGGGSDTVFWENGQTVTTNYTITNNTNAGTFGPVTINSGVTVTVGAGETWTVI